MNDVVIKPEIMTNDAERVWQNASSQMEKIKAAIPQILTADFSLVFDCFALASSYQKAITSLGDFLDGGSIEFLRFEKKLLEAVIIYGESHGMSESEIAALEAEIDL